MMETMQAGECRCIEIGCEKADKEKSREEIQPIHICFLITPRNEIATPEPMRTAPVLGSCPMLG